jgi:sarcosine oxidase subunit beta
MREGLSTLTTSKSAECFRGQFTEPAMVALAAPSIELFENFAAAVGLPDYDISIHQRGYLFVTDDPAQVDDLKSVLAAYARVGVEGVELLDGAALRARFPFLAPGVVAGTFRARDGWLSAHELTQGFARASGARFLLRTRATAINTDAQGVCGVETNRGTISTRVVVDAAGPFSGEVARMVGIELPLETVRRQKVVLGAHPQIPRDAPFTIDLTNGAYWRPEAGGGALLGWVDPDEPVTAPAEDLPTDWEFPSIVLDKAAHLTPFWNEVAESLHGGDVHVSAGHYCYTPDDQPLLGPTEVPGFHLNCGYWAGVMLSPEAGRWVTEMILGRMDPRTNPLRLSRFQEGAVVTGGSLLRGKH